MFSKWFSLMFLFSAGVLAGDLPVDDVIASDSRPWFLAATQPKATVTPVYPPSGGSREDLIEIIDDLEAKSGDISEPSAQSEERYVRAVRTWLDTLEPFKRERARTILRAAHPDLQVLREAIRNKKLQLASISFDKGMPPETLPRLGMELQKLRANLNAELKRVGDRLRHEVGVEIGPADEDSFWLAPPPEQED